MTPQEAQTAAMILLSKSGAGGQGQASIPQPAPQPNVLPRPFNPNDQGFNRALPGPGSDAGFSLEPGGMGHAGQAHIVGGGAGMGGGSAGSGGSWGGPDEAILRRLLEGQAGATSRVDPFNPMQSGSRYRPDESINDDSGVMTPQGIQNEAIQAALGRQTSRSSGPPQAMEDYVKQAVMAALSKAPIVGGQR